MAWSSVLAEHSIWPSSRRLSCIALRGTHDVASWQRPILYGRQPRCWWRADLSRLDGEIDVLLV